jgi:hypothetical protein
LLGLLNQVRKALTMTSCLLFRSLHSQSDIE